ncbi:MAG: hypothetical protein JWP27_919 [Flaviaesturariibacter sp.]|nr:hypothetical protein [Flaviaesturariibacter sp.]
MKQIFFLLAWLAAAGASAQELYPYSEPASNMPVRSLSLKLTAMYERGVHSGAILQRYIPEVMLGLSRKWMVHGSLAFSNMHRSFLWEGGKAYAKYRFLSNDGVHRHFRMAAFGAAAYSRNHLDHNEISLNGDHSGVQAGLIATQLVNRFATSGTASVVEVLNRQRWQKNGADTFAFRAFQYSLSTGLLVLPVTYTDYDQTNVNVYLEMFGNQNLDNDHGRYFVDLAPSLQAIFRSTGKLSVGYRFQVAGDIYRLAKQSVMVSYEQIFLGALRRKKPLKQVP